MCERFSPHDTTFSIATAAELKDSKLASACSLHAASGSTSSSTSSIRRRRLGEIAEEDEEEQHRASKRQSVGEIVAVDATEAASTSGLETSPPPPRPETPVTLNADLAASPDQGNFTTATDPPDFTGAADISPRKSFDTTGRRLSSQSTRPEFYSSYGRQKVRLGPRPSMDTSGRPRTAAPGFRPISSIPAGFKAKGSKKGKSKDGTSDDVSIAEQSEVSDVTFTPNIPIPPTPESSGAEEPPRPHTSSGASFVMPSFKTAPVKERITPEKARLMKAMQLREKKKKMSMLPPVSTEDSPEAQEQAGENKTEPSKSTDESEKSTMDHLTVEDEDEDDGVILSTADSAIVMEATATTINDHASDATQSDSHPTSPYIASSEADQSTKASSLSESTDETVQARDSIVEKEIEEPAKSINEPEIATEEPAVETPSQDAVEEAGPVNEPENIERPATPLAAAAEEPAAESERQSDEATPVSEVTTQQESASSSPATEFPAFIPDAAAEEAIEEPVAPKPEPVTEQTSEQKTDQTKSPQLRIPKSKFSTPDLRAEARFEGEPPVPAIAADAHEKKNVNREPEPVAKDEVPKAKGHSKVSSLGPIKTDLDKSARSSRRLSDDDELLDELQSAVVQEAMPIAVSPRSPAFGGQEGAQMASSARAVSQPIKKPTLLSPADIPPAKNRSVSSGTAFLNRLSQSQQSNDQAPKKATNIGSSISQRIKALEKLSSSGGQEGEAKPTAPRASFFSARKSTVREPSRSPSVIDRATSFSKNSPPPVSRDGSSPETSRSRERSASLHKRLSMFETGVSPPRGRSEVQVRARIVRDGSQKTGDKDSDAPLDLKQSPLVVDHRRHGTSPLPSPNPVSLQAPRETIQERRMSKETRRSESRDRSSEVGRKGRRSSLSIMKDFIKDSLTSPSVDNLMAPTPSTPSRSPSRPATTHQTGAGFSRRLSISSRRSSVSRDMTPVGSPSAMTEGSSGDDARSLSSDKRPKSRAGRFMRRLSSSLGGGRGKNAPAGISPTLHEEVSSEAVDAAAPKMTALMGDVNVQFPDNLLWKRRCMALDSAGFLVLSTTAAAASAAGAGVRRFHMGEFRKPYVPEMEVQELPNSVVLDFLEGSGLQVACEDRAGQMNVLQSELFPLLLSIVWYCLLTVSF